MNCQSYQEQFSRWLDSSEAIPLAQPVETHFESCPECAHFRRITQTLDEQLTISASRKVLPDEFTRQLLVRADQASAQRAEGLSIEERRRQLEQEYYLAEAALNRQFLIPQASILARVLPWGAGGLGLAWGANQLVLALDSLRGATSPAWAPIVVLGACLTLLWAACHFAAHPGALLRLLRPRRSFKQRPNPR